MKNYVIIGGSSGIGRAIAKKLAHEGNRVYATYNQNKLADEAGISYYPLNVLDENPDLHFLPDVVDGLAYCPGSIHLRSFERFKVESFLADFELQVMGAIKVIQKAIPQLKAARHSSVVLFSTVAVQRGFNLHSQVALSKGAIEGLTRSLAAEFAPSIRFNAVAPSLTDTPLAEKLLNTDEKRQLNEQRHPLKQIGTAENIADTVVYLLTEKSSWITGQIIHVDGGMSSINVKN